MKKILLIMVTSLMLISIAACSDTTTDDDTGAVETTPTTTVYKIGSLQLVEHPALDAATEGFFDGLAANGFVDGENLEVDYQNAQGDSSNCETIATKFVNDQVDLIFANATPAAQAAASKTTDIPILITAVTDPESAGLVDTNEMTNTNVTGTSDLTPVNEQIALLQEIFPDAKTVAVMYTSSEDNSIFQKDIAVAALEASGLEAVEASVSDTTVIQSVTESLIGKVDAIYIGTDNLLAENMPAVANVANAHNLPIIVGEEGMVENGGLATYGLDYYNLGFETGRMAAEVLNGADPAEMPISYLPADDCELIINLDVAEQLGIEIPESVLAKADQILE